MPRREWQVRVEDILDAIQRIEQYVSNFTFEEFTADQRTVDAVVRNLEIVGEAVRHLLAIYDDLPRDIPWKDIAGMRHVLAHEYFGVDTAILWRTIADDLPLLRQALERLH